MKIPMLWKVTPDNDGSQQGFDKDVVWTENYVESLAKDRANIDYIRNYTVPLSDRSNQYLMDCKNVLDVGCGWMPYTPDERYTGVDGSMAMINMARELHPATRFYHATAYELPFEDKSFEGVRSTGMLRHMKNWKPALQEMLRVGNKKLAFTHLIGGNCRKQGRYQWTTTLWEVLEVLPNYPQVWVVRRWNRYGGFCSVLFMVEL